MTERINHQWQLASRPVGDLTEANFNWIETPVPALQDGEILIRSLYLSLDPANRGWVREGGSYRAEIALGAVMEGGAVGIVEESNNPKFTVGDHVQTMIGWQEYLVSDGKGVSKLPVMPGLPLTAYLGLFGHIGLTAYFGLLDVQPIGFGPGANRRVHDFPVFAVP